VGCVIYTKLEKPYLLVSPTVDAASRPRYYPWMNRTRLAVLIAGSGFVLALFYMTLLSMPDAPPSGAAHSGRGAADACVQAVRDSVTGARFPFSANVAYQGDARYRLSGTVEAPLGGEVVRRNYECVVQYEDTGRYHADSVRVWQSH
jgi:hypothetical protein